MDAERIQRDIAELEKVQKQAHWWRIGSGLLTLAVVGICLASMNDAVQGLTQPGPRQEQFTSTLSEGLQKDVVPQVQTLATQALTEVRPEVESEFRKIGERMPEFAEASYEQLNMLQESLPKKGEKVVGDTFGTMLAERESKIKEMFPDVTEDKVETLVKNLSEVAQERAAGMNDKLMGRHMDAIEAIVADMEHIRLTEKGVVGANVEPNWEMALSLLDVVRSGIRETVPASGTGSTIPGPKADAKSGAATMKGDRS